MVVLKVPGACDQLEMERVDAGLEIAEVIDRQAFGDRPEGDFPRKTVGVAGAAVVPEPRVANVVTPASPLPAWAEFGFLEGAGLVDL